MSENNILDNIASPVHIYLYTYSLTYTYVFTAKRLFNVYKLKLNDFDQIVILLTLFEFISFHQSFKASNQLLHLNDLSTKIKLSCVNVCFEIPSIFKQDPNSWFIWFLANSIIFCEAYGTVVR